MIQERHTVALPGGELALVLHVPDTAGPTPCVLACHGLSASKDSDKYLLLGEVGLPWYSLEGRADAAALLARGRARLDRLLRLASRWDLPVALHRSEEHTSEL